MGSARNKLDNLGSKLFLGGPFRLLPLLMHRYGKVAGKVKRLLVS